MRHIPALDGLRAIAVLAVIAYHAGVGGAGFVGVDVFFVISGYLISRLLLTEHQATGRIDFLAFYARRVRRILPAAAVVVLVVLALSTQLLPRAPQAHTALSAASALAFVANVFFQFTSGGYFDGRAEEMPLLHLWSLSVEEQFYFLWPALLLFFLRWRRVAVGVVALGLASFGLAEWLMHSNPQAAFYEMPARFWELAAGGLIAAMPERALPRWVAPVALVALLAACAVPVGHFPGVGALPAVLASAALIAALHGGASSALLESRPMVAVGLISYSLYLWHWPLLAFYRATSIGEGELSVRLLLCALAFPLAAASYRYVEQPIRRMRWPTGRTVAIGFAASAAVALSACMVGLREPPTVADPFPLATQAEQDLPPDGCRYRFNDTQVPKCPDPAGATVAIWGDSMAYAWRPFAERLGVTIDYSRDACGPYLGWLPDKVWPGDLLCRDYTAKVAARMRADTLVIAARWEMHRLAKLPDSLAVVAPKVRRVLIIGPTPEMRDLVPRCIRLAADCGLSRAQFDAQAAPILATLRRDAARFANVEVIDVTDHFCTATKCPPVLQGVPLYWDSHHVSSTAARSLRVTLSADRGISSR